MTRPDPDAPAVTTAARALRAGLRPEQVASFLATWCGMPYASQLHRLVDRLKDRMNETSVALGQETYLAASDAAIAFTNLAAVYESLPPRRRWWSRLVGRRAS